MSQLTFETFAAAAKTRGFEEVLERTWQPSLVLDAHTHPFAVKALVVQGEMWLVVEDQEQHLLPGDAFTLERGVPHIERYGTEGATYWAARRHS
jgi:mannose-6-phosphate isomerase-like protein (cupin superfamily)